MSSKITISKGKSPALLLQVQPGTQVTTVLQKPPAVINDGSTVGIGEAPMDGEQYARENAQWEIVRGTPGPEGPEGPQGAPGSSTSVFNYKVDTHSTAPNDPGTGLMKYNTVDQTLATALYFDWLTTDGFNPVLLFQITHIDDKLVLQDKDLATFYQLFRITGPAINHPDWFEVPVAFVEGTTQFDFKQNIVALIRSEGEKGDTGPVGPPSFPDAPVDGKKYERFNASWLADPIQTDAPNDTLMYGRKGQAWARSVAVAGDTMTGNLLMQPVAGTALIALINSGGTNQNSIQGFKANTSTGLRWQMQLGDGNAEAAGNVGSNFGVWRYDNAGTIISQALAINRATGAMDVYGRIGSNADIVTSNGYVMATNYVFCGSDQSFAMRYNATYPNIVFSLDGRRLELSRATGDFYITGTSNNILHNFGSNGSFSTGAISSGGINASGVINASGRITSNASGDVAAIYASAGGIYSDWNSASAVKANVGGMWAAAQMNCDSSLARTVNYAHPGNGYQFQPQYFDWGGGGYGCEIAYGSPNYGNFHTRFFHQSGNWVGWNVTSSDSKEMRWSGQSGEVKADSFVPWSDLRMKTDLVVIGDARAKVAALTGYTYFMPASKDYNGNPIRRAGLIAQEALPVFPVVVSLDVPPNYGNLHPDFKPKNEVELEEMKRFSLDYNGIVALLVNDNNAMAARIEALEARLALLEGA